jgi:hypothetical protein
MRERIAGAALAAGVVLAACVEKTETEKSETEKSKIKVDITGGGNHGDPIPGVADTASFEYDTPLLRAQAVPVLAALRSGSASRRGAWPRANYGNERPAAPPPRRAGRRTAARSRRPTGSAHLRGDLAATAGRDILSARPVFSR